jgi:hypothetical protein
MKGVITAKRSTTVLIDDDDDAQSNQAYYYYSDKGYTYHSINSGSEIVNKLYSRDITDKQDNDFSILEIAEPIRPTDYRKPLPDILSLPEIVENTPDKQALRLSQLIERYANKGVARLIIFDFSCSIFFDNTYGNPHDYLSEDQSARYIRRYMCKEKVAYGGNRNKYKNKNKNKYASRRTTKQNKKRTTKHHR